MRFYFIRHGESEGNAVMRCYGQYDGALTPLGEKQAEAAAKALSGVHFDKIYSSDLQRAYKTALAQAKGRGIEVIKNPGLREIFVGDWENQTWDYIETNYKQAYYDWIHHPEIMKAPGGEAMTEVYERITDTVEKIAAENNPDSAICVVSHCCVLKNLMCYFMKRPLSRLNEVWITNASYTVADYDGKDWNVVSVSNDKYLEPLGVIAVPPWSGK